MWGGESVGEERSDRGRGGVRGGRGDEVGRGGEGRKGKERGGEKGGRVETWVGKREWEGERGGKGGKRK